MNKKVLLIAYHFPPAAGSGVRRSFAYARYLQSGGWDPIVLTGQHDVKAVSTRSLTDLVTETEVHSTWSPYLPKLLSIRGRYPGFLGLPEGRIVWWITAVIKALSINRESRPDMIWCTYPIPTALLIGLTVAKLTGLPLVADLRDAMTDDKFPLEKRRRKIYQWIERRVCTRASKVVFTTNGTRDMYRDRFPDIPESRWVVLPNGYDEEMFGGTTIRKRPTGGGAKRVLLHSGLIYPSERDPTDLFTAVEQLVKAGRVDSNSLEIRLRAPGHIEKFQRMIDEKKLERIICIEPPIDYREALAEMFTVDGLLVLQGASCNHQVPAKVYEYLRAGTPILGLTDPDGDTGSLMRDFGVRNIVPLNDASAIADGLLSFLKELDDGAFCEPDVEALSKFSRKSQALDLARLLSSVVNPARL